MTLDFSRPGKPTDNPFIESFNGSFRDECLNVNWFLSLADAKGKIRLFKEEYNGFRPHGAWSGLTPNELVQQHSQGPIFHFRSVPELGGAQNRNVQMTSSGSFWGRWSQSMASLTQTPQTILFDGFISYSHAADGRLAPSLQRGLESIARPWYRLRALRLFRDETNLSANPNLWSSIEDSLAKSRQFILLASVESANSRWVAKEIEWWLVHRSATTLLIVLTDGEIVWDDTSGTFDPLKSTAIPPALYSAFSGEPFYVDLRWVRNPIDLSQDSARLRSALLDIAATLRGISKDEVDGEAVRTLRRNRYWALSAIVALLVAMTWALFSRDNAVKSSLRTSLELDAKRVIALTQTKDQASALPLAILTASGAIDQLAQARFRFFRPCAMESNLVANGADGSPAVKSETL